MPHALAGRKQSPEHIANRVAATRAGKGFKISPALEAATKARVGKPLSPAHKAKISAALQGNTHTLGVFPSAETRAKLSASHKGLSSRWLKGRKLSAEHRRNISAFWAAHPEKHNRYVDGKSAERIKVRSQGRGGVEYRLWREAVLDRDRHSCVQCGIPAVGHLHADHIKLWALYPELRYDINNGRTLCEWCHYETPTHGCRSHRPSTKDLVDL